MIRPTIREVAERAGVAPTTVSRVLNNSGYVSQETRRRVEAAVVELGYLPNMLSRGLRLKRTNVIALIVSDITNPFWTTVTRGVEDAAQAEGITVILCNTDEKPAKLEAYVKVLMQQQVDGILMAPADDSASAIQAVQAKQIPLVVVDRVPDDVCVDVVRGDSEGGAFQLTEYLLSLGHRRIAILSGPATASTSKQRIAGYQQAIAARGLAADPTLIFSGEYNPQHGYETATHLMASAAPPSAIFAGNSMIAVGVLSALTEMGVRVPEDLSVAGFDDLVPGVHMEPFLTIVNQFPYQLGYTAAQVLLRQIDGTEAPGCRNMILPVELMIRRSCQALAPQP